ncbi:MAG: U32 family peptidase C-terminal domain-containing protein, partial [Lachnospiraceae bacterium]|nr:U32 family peptidase C-terminal domain-containing protein [Lachnospiraceae bacterium]
NRDLEAAEAYFQELKEIKPDALIISDPGMFTIARKVCPEIEIHISTQANNTNYQTCLFWHELGAKRVVCARELSLGEIAEIRAHIPQEMEIEAFVHGAMCISYSGRCLLSAFLTGRDANQGECTHPCRWNYALMEEKRPGEYFPVEENERGTYLFNSRDLCMIGHIPELCGAGIDSFKIEGRMKTVLYVATVTRAYRRALDDYFADPALYEKNREWYQEEVEKCTHRPYATGFFFGKPGAEIQIYESSTYVNDCVYLGTVQEVTGGMARITQKNKFCVGDAIQVIKPDGRNISVKVSAMYDETMEPVESCPHSRQTIWLKLSQEPEQYDILRTIPETLSC